jgi:hypothetical protein
MQNDNHGNNFGQYVIPPTSNSVNETIADNTTSHIQTNVLVSTKRPFLTQINDHKDIRRVRDYLATQNLAHDKSMRKNLFIKDLRDIIVFGYSQAKEAGRLPAEYMIDDVFNLEHDAFFVRFIGNSFS